MHSFRLERYSFVIGLECHVPSLTSLTRNRRTRALIVRQQFIPEGMPTTFTHEYLRIQTAADVEALLPKHHHETFGHPMREVCEEADLWELQD
jgi:hypothetical protein